MTRRARLRALALLALFVLFALFTSACSTEEKPPMTQQGGGMSMLDGGPQFPFADSSFDGTYEDHTTIPIDPLDRVDTEQTPLVDLPLVIAHPRGPRSTATIRALVLDTYGNALRDVGVSAGGPMVLSNAFGIAELEDVYGDGIAEVYAYSTSYTIGHARVPLREGERSHTVIAIEPMLSFRHADITMAGNNVPPPPPPLPDGSVIEEPIDAGGEEEPALPPVITVELAAAAFELPNGETPMGPANVRTVWLGEPKQAAAVPGAMIGIVGDERVPLDALVSFELRVLQGNTELTMVKDAEVAVPWPGEQAPAADVVLKLYRFEPARGAFVEHGTLERDATAAIATIDRTGHWLIGAPATETRCTTLTLQHETAPVAHACALVVGTAAFAMTRVETGADGTVCAVLSEDAGTIATVSHLEALGSDDTSSLRVTGDVALSLAPAQCGAECASVTMQAEALASSCVRGLVDVPLTTSVSAVGMRAGEMITLDTVITPGQEFCLDVDADSELVFSAWNGSASTSCTDVAAAARNGAFCGSDGCTDLGTITCCFETEICGGAVSADEDCDGTIDEGCTCGGVACIQDAVNGCCTPADQCGAESPITGQCVLRDSPISTPFTCPTAVVPVPNNDTVTAEGCCRVFDMRCGLMDATFGCVAPENAQALWGPTVTIPEQACTP